MNPTSTSHGSGAQEGIIELFLETVNGGRRWTPLAAATASQTSITGCQVRTARGTLTISYDVVEGRGDNGETIPIQAGLSLALKDAAGSNQSISVPETLHPLAWNVLLQSHAVTRSGFEL